MFEKNNFRTIRLNSIIHLIYSAKTSSGGTSTQGNKTQSGATGSNGKATGSGSTTPTAAPPGPFSNRSWAQLVLRDVGVPETSVNIDNMTRWMTAENPPASWWGKNNPLNASGPAGAGGSAGLGSFPDLTAAATATAKIINQTNMAGIKKAFAANANANDFSTAVVKSPWAESHYGVGVAGAGKYAVAGRGLTYLATIPVPKLIIATIDHGTNSSGTTGTGS